MERPKIIFIINSIQQQRCIKRIEEFIENGYEVVAYGFNRDKTIPTKPTNFTINIIGKFSNKSNYFKRILLLYKTLKPVLKQYDNESVIFYYFLFDIAFVSRYLSKKSYIYEESDLMQTYLKSKILCFLLNILDRYLIKKSLFTIMTSEGFSHYHFGENNPKNIHFIPNKLNRNIINIPLIEKQAINVNKLRFAFVGGARFQSLFNFIKILTQNFSQHEFHFFGKLSSEFEQFIHLPNVFYHGVFSNPIDLPKIYSNIDIIVATYDVKFDNVKYAEPNKLYEAIYFETPIIVSKKTYLSKKVDMLEIGFSIDPLNDNEVITFIQELTEKKIKIRQDACKQISKKITLNINDDFFFKLKNKISML